MCTLVMCNICFNNINLIMIHIEYSVQCSYAILVWLKWFIIKTFLRNEGFQSMLEDYYFETVRIK